MDYYQNNLTYKENILKTMNIAGVYCHYFPEIQRTSGNVNVSSPFRDDTKPSFSINLDNGLFNDLGGEKHGDIFEFVKLKENLQDFKAVLQFCADNFTNGTYNNAPKPTPKPKEPVKPIPADQLDIYIKNLQRHEPKQIYDILMERKIDLDLCRQLQIGAGVVTFRKDNKYEKFDTIIIPFELDEFGNAIKYKKIPYLNKEKQSAYIRNTYPATIYPSQYLSNKSLVLSEGELDALALISNGINAITATAGAGTFSNVNQKELFEQLDEKDITILYDNDEPGQNHANASAGNLIHKSSVKLAKWDRNKKGYDVGDFFTEKRPVQDLLHILNNAEPFRYKTDYNKLRNDYEKKIYIETKTSFVLMQNVFVDILYNEYYRDPRKKLILASSIEGTKRNFYLYSDGYWKRTNREVIKAEVYKLLKYPFTNNTITSIVDMLLSQTYIEYEKFNARTDLINLNNCAYDLVNFKQIPHDPEHYFNFKNEYDFDQTAKCPVWDSALIQYSMNDETWIHQVWEIFGYAMTGGYDIQKMFWWAGPGGTGKSSTTRILSKLVGLALTRPNFNPANLAGRFYNKSLIGKRIAITGDLDNFLMNINIIKQLTGGDRQTTDVKGSDEIEFENTAKIIFCMNSLPTIPSGESLQPFLRRILLLPFYKKISKYQPGIEKKFDAELSGIFNKAVLGLKRLRSEIKDDNGVVIKETNEFTFCKRGTEMLKFYGKNVNIFESFCNDEIIVERDAKCYNYEIWDRYCRYMDERAGMHWSSDRINVRSLPNMGARIKDKFSCEAESKFSVRNKGTAEEKRGHYVLYHGIRLNNIDDFPETEADIQERLLKENEDLPF